MKTKLRLSSFNVSKTKHMPIKIKTMRYTKKESFSIIFIQNLVLKINKYLNQNAKYE